ncbi:MAG: glutamate--tRNA ligase [Pseudomonadota bacterium]
MTATPLRVRFAPSPTGHLHIGGARTALFNWLLARRLGGQLVLRLEDTDAERSTVENEQEILRDLGALGLTWDEGPDRGGPFGPYRQTERARQYRQVLERLIASGHAYRCTCSTERVEALRQEAMAEKRDPKYDGHCRERGLGPDCGPHVVRFKMPLEGEIVIEDMVKGTVSIKNEQLDDFVLARSNGDPTYNFVVVVDDHLMAITHVIRGDDHLGNTPKQVHIYRALGAEPPRFGHVPLILGPDGKRLSKRHGATSVGAYIEAGYLPEGLVNYLVRLGWAHGDQEIFSVEELIRCFSVEGIGLAAGRWDASKLDWVNQQWIARLPAEDLAQRVAPFLLARGLTPDQARLTAAVATVQPRSTTLVEAAEKASFYFVADDALEYDPKALQKHLKPARLPLLAEAVTMLEGLEPWNHEALEQAITTFLEARGLSLGALAQPLRVAVCGQGQGPGIFETIAALGRSSTLTRVRRAMALASLERAT